MASKLTLIHVIKQTSLFQFSVPIFMSHFFMQHDQNKVNTHFKNVNVIQIVKLVLLEGVSY